MCINIYLILIKGIVLLSKLKHKNNFIWIYHLFYTLKVENLIETIFTYILNLPILR